MLKRLTKVIGNEYAADDVEHKPKENSELSRYIGDLILPPDGFGKGANGTRKDPPTGGPKKSQKKFSFAVISSGIKYKADKMTVHMELKTSSNKKITHTAFDMQIAAENGKINMNEWVTELKLSVRLASDDGFWRYMSLKVIPDIVAVRWGKNNDSHYWSTPGRVWLKQIWWYIYLSWKENEETTRKIVESPNCSTDTILNFVERTGKKGTCVDAYRWIIYYYSLVPATALSEYNKKGKNHNLFRVVMKLNTARMMVCEPALCIGGCKGYVKKLFIDAEFDFNLIQE